MCEASLYGFCQLPGRRTSRTVSTMLYIYIYKCIYIYIYIYTNRISVSGVSKRGFSRYGVSICQGWIFAEHVWVTGVEARRLQCVGLRTSADIEHCCLRKCSLEPLLNHHFVNRHLRMPDHLFHLFAALPTLVAKLLLRAVVRRCTMLLYYTTLSYYIV